MTAQAFIAGQRVTFLPMRLVHAANDTATVNDPAADRANRFFRLFPCPLNGGAE